VAINEANHPLYEANRLVTTSAEDRYMLETASRLSSETLDHPPNIERLGIPKVRP